ncbi:hypothetical protein ACFS6H_02170 [Terrimonas rubra]|uniref:DUF1735 domain-containing protein n=1 Tax=Terrimonas rubra TaxID=1035890 RepID=A0ABW6A1Q8_9BACT
MKPILTACALALTLLFTGCDKVKDLIKVNVTTSVNIDFEIDPINETAVTYTDIQANIANELDAVIKAENSELGVENIKSAKVQSCVITTSATSAPDDNFTALNNLSLAIESDNKPGYTTYAAITTSPTQPYSVELPITAGVDLKDYLKGNTFGYKFTYSGKRKTTTTLQCRARVTYLLNVGL